MIDAAPNKQTAIRSNNDSFVVKTLNLCKNIITSDKKIGDLNGKWATMFKLMVSGILVLIPTSLGWVVWVTDGIYQAKSHLQTCDDYHVIKRINILEKANVKQQDFEKRIVDLELKFAILNKQINALDKNNTSEHSKIITKLESIHELLEYLRSH